MLCYKLLKWLGVDQSLLPFWKSLLILITCWCSLIRHWYCYWVNDLIFRWLDFKRCDSSELITSNTVFFYLFFASEKLAHRRRIKPTLFKWHSHSFNMFTNLPFISYSVSQSYSCNPSYPVILWRAIYPPAIVS